ncbi:MAG: arginine deiminase-related protein [Gammaproteobacteria bacterium]
MGVYLQAAETRPLVEPGNERQSSSAVMMVRPAHFHSNPQTAASNKFQRQEIGAAEGDEQTLAIAEFEGLVAALRDAGVKVIVFDDTPEPEKPDAIFPNNWVTTHADGTVVLYSMMAENRRAERRLDIVESLSRDHGYQVSEVIDLGYYEESGRFLEGTGSLVLDHVNRIAYACLSPRTHMDVLGDFGQRLDYEIVAFDATDKAGAAIYHTNVLMCIGSSYAVICVEAIPDTSQRNDVIKRLDSTNHAVIEITHAQMVKFAGNALELSSSSGDTILVMSKQADDSLTQWQKSQLAEHARIVSESIDYIEDNAGGSVRCMLAEVFLPRKSVRDTD